MGAKHSKNKYLTNLLPDPASLPSSESYNNLSSSKTLLTHSNSNNNIKKSSSRSSRSSHSKKKNKQKKDKKTSSSSSSSSSSRDKKKKKPSSSSSSSSSHHHHQYHHPPSTISVQINHKWEEDGSPSSSSDPQQQCLYIGGGNDGADQYHQLNHSNNSNSNNNNHNNNNSFHISSNNLYYSNDNNDYHQHHQVQEQDDSDLSSSSTSSQFIFDISLMPEVVVRKIIGLTVGRTIPNKHFSPISLVSRKWFKFAVKSIRSIYYHYPYIYENQKEIRKVKLLARWVSPNNHFGVNNQIASVNLGFGFDTSGFYYLYDHLLQSSTLRSVRLTFFQKEMSIERVKHVATLITSNKNIKKLDLSSNKCSQKSFGLVMYNINMGLAQLTDLSWRKADITAPTFFIILEAVVSPNSLIQSLNLSQNFIEIDEEIERATALIANVHSKLKRLDLSFNLLSFHTLTNLTYAICQPPCKIQTANFINNNINEDQKSSIFELITLQSSKQKKFDIKFKL